MTLDGKREIGNFNQFLGQLAALVTLMTVIKDIDGQDGQMDGDRR